jgi:hypothetical protein
VRLRIRLTDADLFSLQSFAAQEADSIPTRDGA